VPVSEIDDHQVLLARAYFYEVDEDAMRLDKVIHGAQGGDEESGHRLTLMKGAIYGRYIAFTDAGGAGSPGTDELLHAIDEAIEALPGDVRRMAQARNLARAARGRLAAAAMGKE